MDTNTFSDAHAPSTIGPVGLAPIHMGQLVDRCIEQMRDMVGPLPGFPSSVLRARLAHAFAAEIERAASLSTAP